MQTGLAEVMLAPHSKSQDARRLSGRGWPHRPQTRQDLLAHLRRATPLQALCAQDGRIGVGGPDGSPIHETNVQAATGAQPFAGTEARRRSLAKAGTWRIAAGLDTFVLSFLITGSFALAGSISAIEFCTKILLYYFHERIWALVPWGTR